MSRRSDLEHHIRESLKLIRDYEEIIRLSNDPKERTRSRKAIDELSALLNEHLQEYLSLCKRLDLSIPEDIAELAISINVRINTEVQEHPIQSSILRDGKTPIHAVVITIREDENRAVLMRLPDKKIVSGHNRTYTIGNVQNRHGERYSVAVIRTPEQGPNAAQDTTRDAIEDLDPTWIMVVGIAGAMPDSEFTLGDVIVGTRLHDFTVGAYIEGAPPEFINQGGPMTKKVQDLVALLPSLEHDLAGWEIDDNISRPGVKLSEANFYGDASWQRKTKASLEFHFRKPGHRTVPIATTRAIASSGFLIKDTKILDVWKKSARDLMAVEMELTGVYAAAKRRNKEYPVIAIRGISDIVGFRRATEWTSYACQTAGSFCFSVLRNMPAHFMS